MQDGPDLSGIHISLKREDPKLKTPTTKDLKLDTKKLQPNPQRRGYASDLERT
jgi:hypothetical protein